MREEFDTERPEATRYIEAREQSAVKITSNDALPYLWTTGVIAALALGLAITGVVLSIIFWHKADVAENHWRNDEVDIRNLQSDVKKLNEASHARP